MGGRPARLGRPALRRSEPRGGGRGPPPAAPRGRRSTPPPAGSRCSSRGSASRRHPGRRGCNRWWGTGPCRSSSIESPSRTPRRTCRRSTLRWPRRRRRGCRSRWGRCRGSCSTTCSGTGRASARPRSRSRCRWCRKPGCPGTARSRPGSRHRTCQRRWSNAGKSRSRLDCRRTGDCRCRSRDRSRLWRRRSRGWSSTASPRSRCSRRCMPAHGRRSRRWRRTLPACRPRRCRRTRRPASGPPCTSPSGTACRWGTVSSCRTWRGQVLPSRAPAAARRRLPRRGVVAGSPPATTPGSGRRSADGPRSSPCAVAARGQGGIASRDSAGDALPAWSPDDDGTVRATDAILLLARRDGNSQFAAFVTHPVAGGDCRPPLRSVGRPPRILAAVDAPSRTEKERPPWSAASTIS